MMNAPLRLFQQFLRDHGGVSIMEFALTLPVLTLMGMGGLELGQYAMTIHRVNQSANALADNMSRVGLQSVLSATQLRERDVIDGFVGVQRQNANLNIPANGRIILSSLERNADGGQWIRWQRCVGTMNRPSAYGAQGTGSTGTGFAGMGPTGSQIQTPPGSGQAVMYVEIKYKYQPLFSDYILPNTLIDAEAAYLVRSPRDLTGTGIFNPNPSVTTTYTCDRFTAS